MLAHWHRQKARKWHVILPVALVMLLFWTSSLPGTSLPEDPTISRLFHWVSPMVQNTLHVPAYAALTLSWRWTLDAWLRTPNASTLAACVIAITCGMLDEVNQSFVPGRFASLIDIALDVTGVAIGIWLFSFMSSSKRSTGQQSEPSQVNHKQ